MKNTRHAAEKITHTYPTMNSLIRVERPENICTVVLSQINLTKRSARKVPTQIHIVADADINELRAVAVTCWSASKLLPYRASSSYIPYLLAAR